MTEFSPHTWGGGLGKLSGRKPRLSLPHTRGGVSWADTDKGQFIGFSPHKWGCFSAGFTLAGSSGVFPTYVGCFHGIEHGLDCRRVFHTHVGGVSYDRELAAYFKESSPHRWGCFLHHEHAQPLHAVFPTYVGVFP